MERRSRWRRAANGLAMAGLLGIVALQAAAQHIRPANPAQAAQAADRNTVTDDQHAMLNYRLTEVEQKVADAHLESMVERMKNVEDRLGEVRTVGWGLIFAVVMNLLSGAGGPFSLLRRTKESKQ